MGGTLFLDVLLVDQILKLHPVNYPASINIGSGVIGLLVALAGLYWWLRDLRWIPGRSELHVQACADRSEKIFGGPAGI